MQSVGAHNPFAINYGFTYVNTVHYSSKFERVCEESDRRNGHGYTVQTFNSTHIAALGALYGCLILHIPQASVHCTDV